LLERYRRKHRIVTGDEKWIFFENPKRKKSWVDRGTPSTSTARPQESLWQEDDAQCLVGPEGIYYELLKPGGTVNTTLSTTIDRFEPFAV